MDVKQWLSDLRQRVRQVKFPKPRKTNVEVKPRKISQKAANRILMGFVVGIVGLSVLTIVSNAIRTMGTKPIIQQVQEKNPRIYSNQISLFMTDFLNLYFSENNAENRLALTKFYAAGLDEKSGEMANADSRLTNATLFEVTENLATYRVEYEVKVGEEWQKNVGLISIPYGVKDGRFYVSDLPYFTNEASYVARGAKSGLRLKDQQDDKKEFEKAKQYVEAFFKAYTSGDKTQMSPFSKEIQPVQGYLLKSMDYVYFIQDDKDETKLVAVVQVTMTDAFELAHQENFVVSLKADKETDSYRVLSIEHGIAEKYRKQIK